MRYKVRSSTVITAAPAFYFQEGYAAAYERARFGRVMVDPDGATLFVTLCNEQGADIAPAGKEER